MFFLNMFLNRNHGVSSFFLAFSFQVLRPSVIQQFFCHFEIASITVAIEVEMNSAEVIEIEI